MSRRAPLILTLAGASLLAGNAQAASTFFGGEIDLRGGYGQNPRLVTGATESTPMFGGDLTAILTRLTETGRTTLTGSADITQSTHTYGRTENYIVDLAHQQQLSTKLQASGDLIYTDTTNPAANYSTATQDLLPIGDVLTIGTHTRVVSGDANLAYQATSRDLFQAGVNAAHTDYSGLGISPYDQYGGSFGYLRTVSDRTKIGAQVSAVHVHSNDYGNSSSVQAGLQLEQKVTAIWTFKGSVFGLFQTANGASFRTVGFTASLCGDYPRLTVCALGSRQSSPSGIGGLRVDTQGQVRVNYKLTALSTVDFEATYDISRAEDLALPTQHYYDAAITYRRKISPRLSAGFSGRYQHRSFDAFSSPAGIFPVSRATGYTATADIAYSFGRTAS